MDAREVNAIASDLRHIGQETFVVHTPRTLVVRKSSSGGVFLSISEGACRSSVYIWSDEIARLIDTVTADGYAKWEVSY